MNTCTCKNKTDVIFPISADVLLGPTLLCYRNIEEIRMLTYTHAAHFSSLFTTSREQTSLITVQQTRQLSRLKNSCFKESSPSPETLQRF